MLSHTFNFASNSPTILLLGAHCDDIEIGCGGTVLRLVQRYPDARYVWVTLSGDDLREAETRDAAKQLLRGAGNVSVLVERFRGSYFPHCGPGLKECIDSLKRFAPDLVLTHFRGDLHQDHRIINELTWNTFRDHAILEYEIPKFDGDVSVPNIYVPLSRAELARKCEILMESFPSQRSRAWFTPETFQSIARLRGIECNAPEGYAEGFFGRKMCISL